VQGAERGARLSDETSGQAARQRLSLTASASTEREPSPPADFPRAGRARTAAWQPAADFPRVRLPAGSGLTGEAGHPHSPLCAVKRLALGAASTGFAYVALFPGAGSDLSAGLTSRDAGDFLHPRVLVDGLSALVRAPLLLHPTLAVDPAGVLGCGRAHNATVLSGRGEPRPMGSVRPRDGLEGFAILVPWFMLLVFFVAAICGRVAAAAATTGAMTASGTSGPFV
jgi:hypothetical protein